MNLDFEWVDTILVNSQRRKFKNLETGEEFLVEMLPDEENEIQRGTAVIKENMEKFKLSILNKVFPIGSTYVTQDITNPSEILGFGDWVRFNGKVALGLSENDIEFNAIGKKGGSKTHTLTGNELPQITGDLPIINGAENALSGVFSLKNVGGAVRYGTVEAPTTTYRYQLNFGGGQAHPIMNPYEVVGYMWKRIK